MDEPESFSMRPIGHVSSPLFEKASAPRQSALAEGVRGEIVLLSGRGFEHALEGIAQFSHLWVVFVFDRALGSQRMKVQPPRSDEKRGVFATRSPHRPNPIGLSVVRLLGVDGLRLSVSELDILDGSPVLDLKPYLPYADAISEASGGWLGADPGPRFAVRWEPRAEAQRAFLTERLGRDDLADVEVVLQTGPEPRPYRRIRVLADGARELARKALRVRFRVSGEAIVIESVRSGYRPAELALPEADEQRVHAAFEEAFRT